MFTLKYQDKVKNCKSFLIKTTDFLQILKDLTETGLWYNLSKFSFLHFGFLKYLWLARSVPISKESNVTPERSRLIRHPFLIVVPSLPFSLSSKSRNRFASSFAAMRVFSIVEHNLSSTGGIQSR